MAFRRHHGLSRNALASLLEIDPHTLWRWEAGRRTPVSQVHIDAIRVLGVTMTAACTPASAKPEAFAFPCDHAPESGPERKADLKPDQQ
jgi:DNA-binding XRE family transcriptional regulator